MGVALLFATACSSDSADDQTSSGLETELAAVGLQVIEWWTDANNDFGVSLSVLI